MVGCCVLQVCAARDSPLTNTGRQRLRDVSMAERWTSRDHDLSKTSGRRSALENLEWCDQTMLCFSFPRLIPVYRSQRDDAATERDTLSTRAARWFKDNCLLEMRMLLLNVHLAR